MPKKHHRVCPHCAENIAYACDVCEFCMHDAVECFRPCKYLAKTACDDVSKCSYCVSLFNLSRRRFPVFVKSTTASVFDVYATGMTGVRHELVAEKVRQVIANLAEAVVSHIRDRGDATEEIRHLVDSDDCHLNKIERDIVLADVLDELVGFGRIGPLLRDPMITAICCSAESSVFVERLGVMRETNVRFGAGEQIQRLLSRLVQSGNHQSRDIVSGGIPGSDWRYSAATAPAFLALMRV